MADQLELHNALKAIEDDSGRLTPEAVVQTAVDPEHILHAHFEWDDTAAARQHRLDQARSLIRSVKVTIEVNHQVVRSVAYIRDPSAEQKEQGYRSVNDIRKDPDEARTALVAEFSRAAAHLRRARTLALAFDMQGDVDNLAESLGVVRRRVEDVVVTDQAPRFG